jgi:hypothetical protein
MRRKKNAAFYLCKSIRLIIAQIERAEMRTPVQGSPVMGTLQWQGTPIELVEVVYALHEAGCFGDTTLKTVFTVVGKAFDCEITNYYRLFWDIRNRSATDRAYFLNRLLKAFLYRLDRMDNDLKP